MLGSFRASLEVLPTRHEYIIVERPRRGVVLSSYTGEMRARGTGSVGQAKVDSEPLGRRKGERMYVSESEAPDGEIRTPLNPILPPNLRWESSRGVRARDCRDSIRQIRYTCLTWALARSALDH